MSTTKGLNSDVRHSNDEYITPTWSIRRFLEAYPIPTDVMLFDPCAARGELIATVKTVLPNKWLAAEINPNHAEALGTVTGLPPEVVCADFLKMPRPAAPDPSVITVSNPPYRYGLEFIDQALAFTKIVSYLLRINFLADGRDRAGVMGRLNPALFVLPNRPSFNGYGGDACEYAWFVFGDERIAGRWFELGQTPDVEIKTWNAAARKRYPNEDPKKRKAA